MPVERLISLVDKRDKLQSKIFQKKVEKLLYLLVARENQIFQNEEIYETKMHEFLWQDDVHHELSLLQEQS